MAQTTKYTLAEALQKIMTQKPFDKITVSDIAGSCNVNRMTFYYHFKDIPSLVDWILEGYEDRMYREDSMPEDWQDAYLKIFQVLQENKEFVLSIYASSTSHDQVEKHLYDITYKMLLSYIVKEADGMQVRDSDKNFIANFYKYSFGGLILDWIKEEMQQEPKDLVTRLNVLIYGDFKRALYKYRYDQPVASVVRSHNSTAY